MKRNSGKLDKAKKDAVLKDDSLSKIVKDTKETVHKIEEVASRLEKGMQHGEEILKPFKSGKVDSFYKKEPDMPPHLSEPFSFAQTITDTYAQALKPNMRSTFQNSDMVEDIKNGISKCMQATNKTISGSMDLGNSINNMFEEACDKWSKTIKNCTEQNVRLTQELFSCKNGQDMISFQRKMYESNFNNALNFYIDMSATFQNFVIKQASDQAFKLFCFKA